MNYPKLQYSGIIQTLVDTGLIPHVIINIFFANSELEIGDRMKSLCPDGYALRTAHMVLSETLPDGDDRLPALGENMKRMVMVTPSETLHGGK